MVKVIGTFSAKGGSGTSVMTVNMAIYLAQKGKKVLLMDAAPNGGNLHTYMNIPHYVITNELEQHFSVLPLINTDYHNLTFFSNLRQLHGPGVSDNLIRWETEIRNSDFDFMFIDLGSYIDNDLLAAINWLDYNLIYTSSDPVSIEKTNYLLERIFFNRLKMLEDKYNLHHIVQNINRRKKDVLFTARNMLLLLSESVPQYGKQINEIVSEMKLGIIFNKIRSSSNSEISEIYPTIVKNYFGFQMSSIGELPYSEVISNSIEQMTPIVTSEKSGEFVEILSGIISRLISSLSKDSRRDQ